MSAERETFAQFIERNSQYRPFSGEEMGSVYRKQHEAFIAYVDEQVAKVLEEVKQRAS